ncbi:MAG TPA: hypothetical protein VGL77_15560, partial [Armatimonadota bacterium]
MNQTLHIYRRVGWGLLLGTLLLAVCVSWLFAAGETKRLSVKADHITSKRDVGNVQMTSYAKAIVTQDDATFTADTIVQRSEGNVHEFTGTGNPVFTDAQNRITGQKVVAYSTPRRAEFSGDVKMLSTPKPRAGAAADTKAQLSSAPTTLTCDTLSYDYAGKKALATGNVVI